MRDLALATARPSPMPHSHFVPDFASQDGDEIALDAPQSLDDKEIERILRELHSRGYLYISELSNVALGDKPAVLNGDCFRDNIPVQPEMPPIALVEEEAAPSQTSMGEDVPVNRDHLAWKDTKPSAVAILVKAHSGSLAFSTALTELEDYPNPAQVLDAIKKSTEHHMRPVREHLNAISHASSWVFTAKEPLTVGECEAGDWASGYIYLGTWQELEESLFW